MYQSLVRSIALMASRLDPEAREGFLAFLPNDLAGAVTKSASQPVDVDAAAGTFAERDLPPSLRALLLLDAGPGAAASLLVQLPLQGKAINRIVTGTATGVTRGSREDATMAKSLRSQLAGGEVWGVDSACVPSRLSRNRVSCPKSL